MSFKTWSAAQDARGESQADDKAMPAPAVVEPTVQPDNMPDKSPIEAPPANKA